MTKKLPRATARTLDDIRRETAAVRDDSPPPPPPPPAIAAGDERRHLRAVAIIERYTTYAAVGGVLPLPLLDTLGVFAVIVGMVRDLARHHGVPVRRDRVRAVVAGLIGGLGQAVAGGALTALLSKLVPGAQLMGMAVASTAAAALTRAIGQVFLRHFEGGGTTLDLDLATLRADLAAIRTA